MHIVFMSCSVWPYEPTIQLARCLFGQSYLCFGM